MTISKSRLRSQPKPSQKPPVSSKAQNQDLRDMMFFAYSKSKYRPKFRSLVHQSDNIQIKFKMPTPPQEPLASSESPCLDLKDMDVLGNFKIKTKPKLGTWVYKRPLAISR